MAEWRTIMTLACGCQLQQLHDPIDERHGEVALRYPGRCREHLCRMCGDAPLGDAQLCHDCILKAQAEL